MKRYPLFIGLLLFPVFCQTAHAQNFLFKEPRSGGFKIRQNDALDFTNSQHFVGSGILALALHQAIRNTEVKHPKVLAGILASGIGLLKEYEDGYREGWGTYDYVFNQLGIISFLLASELTHFTVTVDQVLNSGRDIGVGLRFFATDTFSPLNASFGVYVMRNLSRETWVGLDTHMELLDHAELHFGMSMINLSEAGRRQMRLNIGLAYNFL